MLRSACEVGLSLTFFGPEPAHVPFGTEHKQYESDLSRSGSSGSCGHDLITYCLTSTE